MKLRIAFTSKMYRQWYMTLRIDYEAP